MNAKMKISEGTLRLQSSICRAADLPRLEEATVTDLEDSAESLIELWSDGNVIGHYLMVVKRRPKKLRYREPLRLLAVIRKHGLEP
jgi:hypothetical protein